MKYLGKNNSDYSFAIKKAVDETAFDSVRLCADLTWKDRVSDIAYQSLEWRDWEAYQADDAIYVVAYVAYGKEQAGYHVFQSFDGETFTHILYSVVYTYSYASGDTQLAANGQHIVFEYLSNTGVYCRTISHDYGATWSSPVTISHSVGSLVYGNGYFASCAYKGTTFEKSTDNGTTWTTVTPASTTSVGKIGTISYVPNDKTFVFASLGSTSTGSNNYFTTTDLSTFTYNTLPQITSTISVTYGNGKYVWVLGKTYIATKYLYTSNGLLHTSGVITEDWTASETLPSFNAGNSNTDLCPVAFLDGRFVLVHVKTVSSVEHLCTSYSTDGSVWTVFNDEIPPVPSLLARNICLPILPQKHRLWFAWGAQKIFRRTPVALIQGETAQTSGITEAVETNLKDVQPKLTAGSNVTINENNVISATDTTYISGKGIKITEGVISATSTATGSGNLTFAATLNIDDGDQAEVAAKTSFNVDFRTPVCSKTFTDGKTNIYVCDGTVYQSEDLDSWEKVSMTLPATAIVDYCEFNGNTYFLTYSGTTDTGVSVKVCYAATSTTYSNAVTVFTGEELQTVQLGVLRVLDDKLITLFAVKGTSKISTSTDGLTWTTPVDLPATTYSYITDIKKLGSKYYTMHADVKSSSKTYPDCISSDLTTWTTISANGYPAAVSYATADGVILTTTDTSAVFKYTEDFTTYTNCSGLGSEVTYVWNRIGLLGNKYLLIGGDPTVNPSYAYMSSDGIVWEKKGNWHDAYSELSLGSIYINSLHKPQLYNDVLFCETEFYTTWESPHSYYIGLLQTFDGINWKLTLLEDTTTCKLTYPLNAWTNCVKLSDGSWRIVYYDTTDSNYEFYVAPITSETDPGEVYVDQTDVTEALALTIGSKLPSADGVTITDSLGVLKTTGYSNLKLVTETTYSAAAATSNGDGTWKTIEVTASGTWHDEQ